MPNGKARATLMMYKILFLFVVSTFVSVAVAHGAPPDARQNGFAAVQSPRETGQLTINVVQGRLSAKIDAVSLSAVLKALAEHSGARIVLIGESDSIVGAEFADIPFEEGVRRLLRGRNLAFFYALRSSPGGASYRLSEMRIFPLAAELSVSTTVFGAGHGADSPSRGPAKSTLENNKINSWTARWSKLLRDAEGSQDRLLAATELAKISDPSVIGPLSEALEMDADSAVRAKAAEALAKTWNEAAVAPLTRALLGDPSASVREAAAAALGATWSDHAVSPLISALLGDRDALVREYAARALAQTAGEEAVEALNHALAGDPRAFVRQAAAEALGAIGGVSALDALTKASRDDADDWVREAAALSAINSPK